MKNNKVLFLTLKTFSLTGGIEKVCRCLAKVLSDLTDQHSGFSFKLLAMHDEEADLDSRYISSANFKGFKKKAVSFGISSISRGIVADTIILSHINLLIFAWIINKITPATRIILFAHGIEMWKDLANWKKLFLQTKIEIWAVSSYTAKTLTEMHQVNADRITIVNNALDPYFELPISFEKSASLLKRHQLTKEQPILFTLTRLSSQESYKGYDRVLMAMPALLKKFPNLHYLLAGKGDNDEIKRVNELILKLDLTSNVSIVGFINDDELSDYFKLGNIFVMPSTQEGFGIVFIEAAACGSNVIGGNADGSIDALLNGELGTLVNPEDIEELTKAIAGNLAEKDNPLAIQNLCVSNFSFEQYSKKVSMLLNTKVA